EVGAETAGVLQPEWHLLIGQVGVAAPLEATTGDAGAGLFGVVEEERLLQRLGVVEAGGLGGRLWGGEADGEGDGDDEAEEQRLPTHGGLSELAGVAAGALSGLSVG